MVKRSCGRRHHADTDIPGRGSQVRSAELYFYRLARERPSFLLSLSPGLEDAHRMVKFRLFLVSHTGRDPRKSLPSPMGFTRKQSPCNTSGIYVPGLLRHKRDLRAESNIPARGASTSSDFHLSTTFSFGFFRLCQIITHMRGGRSPGSVLPRWRQPSVFV